MEPIVAAATSTFSTGWDVAGNFLALIILIALLFAFGRYVGRGAFISLVISLYAGYALYLSFPFAKQIAAVFGTAPNAAALAAIALYAVATGASYFAIRKAMPGDYYHLSALTLCVLSVLVAGFLLALAYHSFSITAIYAYPSPLANFFTPPAYFFWWFLAPLAGLIILA